MATNTDPFAVSFTPSLAATLYPLRMEGSLDAPEGLLSWVVRLAEAHCVGPRTLMRQLLSESPQHKRLWSVSTFFDRDCGTINGHGVYAQMMAELIGTGQYANVEQMTLLPLSNLFPRNGEGFLARKLKWCHACLCDQARQGVAMHFPLVWSFEYYKVCHIHQLPMNDCCPACGHSQPFLSTYPSLVHCGHCGESMLAQLPGGFQLDEPEISSFNLWCAGALADLVRQRSALQAKGGMQAFKANVEFVCREIASGSRKSLCRKTGLQPYALNGWFTKGELPSLSILLHLCYGIQIMPAAMFLPSPLALPGHSPTEPPVSGHRKHRPQLGYKERERIKNLLDVIINDRNDARQLIDIAQQVGSKRLAKSPC